MTNKTIEDVADENSCRYPRGAINDPPEYFCGQPRYITKDKSYPYCWKHYDLCRDKKEKT